MINIWGTTFLIGPFLGPALAGYIGAGSNWKASFGVLTAFYALSTILIFLFGYETYYARGHQCQRNSRLQSMFGIKNHSLPVGRTLAHWTKILAIYIFKFPLLLTGIATMVNFCWPIVQSASLRWAPIIGGLLGKQHPRIPDRGPDSGWRPEYRLHGVWVAIGVMACGLLTYGMTLNYHKHWIGLAFGWLMVVFGMISSTVSITAYNLEKYPDQSTVVSAIINAWRTASGFSVGYFQPSWIAKDGTAAVFGTQVAVVVAVLILTITPVIVIEGRKVKPTIGEARLRVEILLLFRPC
ncbi:MFS transporter, putative [Aspergillus fumigatus A1163]|uniref:MFS transporter, putative n=1 Tax=Aspergillus fumigatus (strain CBS 144.89 / FGSC A1163 / CEA10) TaxID=451804 RepID=B0Y549_ASPFC|nr:MFS transporter, putative [Aspergillus fumigatus A1163]